ncbi:phage holin family protein [Klebsiella sp. S69]|uniref:phage holin family protein n=1 Tax=Klebsiella sp. S69 TaxID=2767439 RepID=UPI001903A7D3|nr:phage holin family protein [Klebsiella sp. S69]MBK0167464.1 phage holin family protein [Klebsiella sp. S69]
MENKSTQSILPSARLSDITTRLLTNIYKAASTRLDLITIEINQEKNRILSLILMIGLALIFTTFGLMSLLLYALLFIEPLHQQTILLYFTGVLFLLAIVFCIIIRISASRASLLSETREQLKNDLTSITGEKNE